MAAFEQQVRAVLADEQGQKLIRLAQDRAAILAKRAKASQLRKLFYEIRGIEADWAQAPDNPQKALRRLTMLKPKLAYQVARHDELKPLQQVLEPAIDQVLEQPDRFPRLVELFEAILAYFYAEGGQG
ncbi:type III-A CRISPR-associated protein Csm2 [Candidatus Parcubacteria bacterium]|nr:MAG: type III-A CRISPR-associated protein Csm2 [Candidatus Parcubacteria bacterium]